MGKRGSGISSEITYFDRHMVIFQTEFHENICSCIDISVRHLGLSEVTSYDKSISGICYSWR